MCFKVTRFEWPDGVRRPSVSYYALTIQSQPAIPLIQTRVGPRAQILQMFQIRENCNSAPRPLLKDKSSDTRGGKGDEFFVRVGLCEEYFSNEGSSPDCFLSLCDLRPGDVRVFFPCRYGMGAPWV